jgi:uncharacterized membrane protein YeaQ/YmgE (transglycosylase-associated protein family)
MDIGSLLVSLASGAIGGNLGGKLFKDISLGPVGNSIAGVLGGGLGGWLLSLTGIGGPDASGVGAIISNILGSAVGGSILMAIAGWVKKAMGKG